MEATEIRLLILQEEPLDTLVALNETCRSWRSFMLAHDESLVRPKVLQRVPWMELVPEVGMGSWMDCARLIVARRRSLTEEPDKWWRFNERQATENYCLHELMRNTDIGYLPAENIDGGTLPDTFEPLFESEMAHVQGKYFLSPRGKVLDMTTIKLVGEPIERKRATVYSSLFAMDAAKTDGLWRTKCPRSGVTVESKVPFKVRQQKDDMLVISDTESGKTYIVKDAFLESSNFVFDPESAKCVHFPQYQPTYDLAMTPGWRGVICIEDFFFERGPGAQVKLYYCDLADKDSDRILLCKFPRPNNENISTVIFYAGMMFLNVNISAMVPLWIDLERFQDTSHAFLGNKYCWRTVLMRTGSHIHYSCMDKWYDMVRSSDERWVSSWFGRQVGDLWTFKTYSVGDPGLHTCAPCPHFHPLASTIFVGRSAANQPIFYTVTKPLLETLDSFLYGKRFNQNGFPGGSVKTDPSKFWKKVIQEYDKNPFLAFTQFGDKRRHFVSDQSLTSERLEDPIGLSWLEEWGCQ
ncbi:hypothetical protein LXG23DRAFT_24006 [Yarrowia lipolytica]|jgi:hypothetical protein|uniref:F-box domain-containing protein n=1 Tax=Yarrowia lipolytica TaxID=4952 RepID=A0A1D8NA56_YARLL|nr:hypothetical protein YALI1_C11203g [Yarrowia lipolytica]KAB8280863.1 hypothetical protein BKA91DRAFT_38325 [Yarrowia lipolytica]KAE8169376.1 hypothetical protein BKA90DRAFT_49462 [Yarrowia lipolytica]KAJ8053206.1 hypothetical protein LXG23DRAFT_24006 [Yarrowia lipolytica]RMI94097.1 hypothetical protein BD777DRAFT_27235 [Yarrowia lipolytica]